MSAHAWRRCANAGLVEWRGQVPPRDLPATSSYPTAYPTARTAPRTTSCYVAPTTLTSLIIEKNDPTQLKSF
eukprot:3047085-Prymnesium_polylepis.1